jgi:hypothetical protein
LRQTEGFVRSILAVMRAGLDAPDHTTLSRRSQSLDIAVHNIPATGPLHLIIDSTGLSVVGVGEWPRRNTADVAREAGRNFLWVSIARRNRRDTLTEATVDDATLGIGLIAAAAGRVASRPESSAIRR